MNQSRRNRNKVLIIHDKRQGHLNPSIAVSEMIAKQFYLQLEQFAIPTLSKRTVSIFKKLSHFPRLFNALGHIHFTFLPKSLEHTDVIVCSGMPNLIYGAYLSQRFNIPLIYIGSTRKFNWQLINWMINVVPEKNNSHQISVPAIPARRQISDLIKLPSQHEACLLLGGPTQEYPFTPQEFSNMICEFVKFTDQRKMKASVVCSRRTPDLSAESIQFLQSKQIELVYPTSKTSICDVLKRSEYLFVTEDSATMLSESIQTGRIVISVCREDSAIDTMIQGYLDQQLIQRKTISHLSEAEPIKSKLQTQQIEQMIIQQLVNDLKAKSHDISFYNTHMRKLNVSVR